MKYVFLGLSWIFGGLFFILGIASLFKDVLTALPLLAISLLLLPPVRNFVYAKTNKALSLNVRTTAIAVLLGAFAVFVGQADKRQAEALAAKQAQEEAQKQAQLKQEKINHFKANKATILADMRGALQASDYQKTVALAAPYLDAGDAELTEMNGKAKAVLAEIEKVQKEKERVAKERDDKIKSQFSAWDGSHRALERVIKAAMNDPDSYKHVETVYWDRGDHLVVKTDFRGKNGFGGVVKNSVKAKVSLDGDVLAIIEQR